LRKVIVSNMVTLDGFFAGPNGELDWNVVDEEFNKYAFDLLNAVDTLLFGRVTYQGMASYWPTPAAITADPIIADKMNTIPKVVFSKTLDKVEWGKWNNARLVKDNIADEISKLKQQPGKDMVIFGSGSIVSTLTQLGLIDDYRMIVNPVVLGSGQPLFKDMAKPANLKLLRTKTFKTGVVLLNDEPERKEQTNAQPQTVDKVGR
jgi:dihydrofolate reductase